MLGAVEHIARLILEGFAGYVEIIRQARCRQANEKKYRKRRKKPKIMGKQCNYLSGVNGRY